MRESRSIVNKKQSKWLPRGKCVLGGLMINSQKTIGGETGANTIRSWIVWQLCRSVDSQHPDNVGASTTTQNEVLVCAGHV